MYHFNREEILHATIIKFITSPNLCAHPYLEKVKTYIFALVHKT